MKKTILFSILFALSNCGFSQGITAEELSHIRSSVSTTPADRAISNAMAGTSINQLARSAANSASSDTHFSHSVPSRGISDQKSSGRCWLFTGLNVMRARAIKDKNLGEFFFSQSYLFFYDQLEKSNLFLQAVIDNAGKPMDDRTVEWLFKNPLSDGGTFCGVQDLVSKYGLVPAEVMPERFNANNTSRMSNLLQLKLRQWGLELRTMAAAKKKPAEISARKIEMLAEVYHILTLCLGTPPTEFDYTRRSADGSAMETKHYTPLTFCQDYVKEDLNEGYVMLMNDPSRPYYKTYTIEYDQHVYGGHRWTYINLPMDEIKQMAIASIKDSTMMYFSCDVGKQYDSETGVLSLDNFDYASLLGTDFPMNKADRIRTFASASSHAMTLMAVDLDTQGKPLKWKVENSWGATSGKAGHLIMTDKWFDEYMFRLVVERRFVPAATLQLLNQQPTVLPAWDPLFMGEE